MQIMNTLGFFGDSFCSTKSVSFFSTKKYDTYISKLEKQYDAQTVNMGHGGSSAWDTLLLQLMPFLKNKKFPDICIFVWTNSGRLFNRNIRNINHASALDKQSLLQRKKTKDIWSAANQYYTHLCDPEKDSIEYIALLQYIDNNILPTFPSTTKVIHLWAFGDADDWSTEGFHPNNAKYSYRWTRGMEIRPHLTSISLINSSLNDFINSHVPNHLEGEFKNSLVFKFISDAIDNYKDGKLLDMTQNVSGYWKCK